VSEKRRIYVASSWRNAHQPPVVEALRKAGHEVYDFRNPPGGTGFQWSAVDPDWQSWTSARYRELLEHPVSVAGFKSDWDAMVWANTCVLVLPSGRSAHIEAGYFVGAGKDLFILQLEAMEPELMYRMATQICLSVDELVARLGVPQVYREVWSFETPPGGVVCNICGMPVESEPCREHAGMEF
jgi:hypothetical protein